MGRMQKQPGGNAVGARLPVELDPLHEGVGVETDGCMIVISSQQIDYVDASADN